jgi:hypothetical protein
VDFQRMIYARIVGDIGSTWHGFLDTLGAPWGGWDEAKYTWGCTVDPECGPALPGDGSLDATLAGLPPIVGAPINFVANGGRTSTILLRTAQQLQAKFKHAADFGVIGNYSKANAASFSRALHQHINGPGVQAIRGTYRGQPVTHYLDPATGLNVMADPAGNFISGWRLNPGQLQNVLTHGGL